MQYLFAHFCMQANQAIDLTNNLFFRCLYLMDRTSRFEVRKDRGWENRGI